MSEPVTVVVVDHQDRLPSLVELLVMVDLLDDADETRVERLGTVRDAIERAERDRAAAVVLRVSMEAIADADAFRRLQAAVPECRVILVPCRPGDPAALARSEAGDEAPSAVRVRTLAPQPQSAKEARSVVLDACNDAGEGELSDDAMLVATEMVTNAVVHARTELDLTVRAWLGGVHIEVRDHRADRPAPRTADEMESGGRGLTMMDALCAAWGIDPASPGKVVWAHLVSARPAADGDEVAARSAP